jgi:hypothetical protein
MRAPSRYALATLATFVVIGAAVGAASPSPNRRAVATGFGMIWLPISTYAWCKTDSTARGVSSPPGAMPLLAVAPPIGWLYYLLWTRSTMRALLTVAIIVMASIGCVVIGTLIDSYVERIST